VNTRVFTPYMRERVEIACSEVKTREQEDRAAREAALVRLLNACTHAREDRRMPGRHGDATAALRGAAVALAEFAGSDERITATLIDALDTGAAARPRFVHTLTPLLWNLDPDDAALWLTAARRQRLRRDLLSYYTQRPGPGPRGDIALTHLSPAAGHDFTPAEADYCLTVMRTLALLGDERAAKLLRAVARSRPCGPNSECVASAAEECLSLLRDRVDTWDRDCLALQGHLAASDDGDAARDLLRDRGEARAKLLLLWLLRDTRIPPHSRPRRRAAALLARYNDRRLAAPVIDLVASDRATSSLFDALPGWLKASRPGDGLFLEKRHRAFLRTWLDAPDTWVVGDCVSAEVGVGVLHALSIAGDQATLQKAEDIVHGHSPATDRFRSNALQDAAYACWVRLRDAGPHS
jgi:hypothetical protein